LLNRIKYCLIFNALLFSFSTAGQSTFNNYYQSGSKSSASKIQTLTVNDYLVTSYYIDSLNGQQGLNLTKLNLNGQIVLRKRFLFGNLDFLSFGNNKINCNISNKTMLLTGAGYTGTVSTVIFASINKPTLDTNWSKTYKDGIFEYAISHIFKIKPNQIWFMGLKFSNSSNLQLPVIFKMDTLGTILSIKEFTAMTGYETRQIHYDTLSNLFYIGGENYNSPPNNPYYITCIDTTGNIVWNKYMAASNTLFVYQIKKVGVEVICSGGLKVSNILSYGENKINLFKLNAANGNVIWNKLYGKAYAINTLTAFFEQADGSIICTGSYSDKTIQSTANHDACLLKVNSNGDSLWMKTYGNYGQFVQEYMFDVQPTIDGGYIMCGTPNYANNSHSWVVKTDSLGVAPGMIITKLSESQHPNTEFKTYPNPTNGLLNIDLKISHRLKI
jgi:hypothetical protein